MDTGELKRRVRDTSYQNALLKTRIQELTHSLDHVNNQMKIGQLAHAQRTSEMQLELESVKMGIQGQKAKNAKLESELEEVANPLRNEMSKVKAKIQDVNETKMRSAEEAVENLNEKVSQAILKRAQLESEQQEYVQNIIPDLELKLEGEKAKHLVIADESKRLQHTISETRANIEENRLHIAKARDRNKIEEKLALTAASELEEELSKVAALRKELHHIINPSSIDTKETRIQQNDRRQSAVRIAKEADLSTQIHTCRVECERLRLKLASLASEIKSAESAKRSAVSSQTIQARKSTSRNKMLQEVEQQIYNTKSDITKYRENIASANRSFSASNAKLSRLESEEIMLLSRTDERIVSSKRVLADTDELRKQCAIMEEKVETMEDAIASLSKAVQQKTDMLSEMQCDRNREQGQPGSNLRERMANLSAIVEDLRDIRTNQKQEIDECKFRIKNLKQEEGSLKEGLKNTRLRLSREKVQIDQINAKISSTHTVYAEQKDKSLKRRKEVANQQEEMQELLSVCQKKISRLSEEIEIENKKCSDMRNEILFNNSLLDKSDEDLEYAKISAKRQQEKKKIPIRRVSATDSNGKHLVFKKHVSSFKESAGSHLAGKFMLRAYAEAIKKNKYFSMCSLKDIEERFLSSVDAWRSSETTASSNERIPGIVKTPPGKYLFLQGHKGQTAYVVLKGKAKIVQMSDTGVVTVIKHLTCGDVVGEFIFSNKSHKVRTASVMVDEEENESLLTLEFNSKYLRMLGPPFSDKVIKSMCS